MILQRKSLLNIEEFEGAFVNTMLKDKTTEEMNETLADIVKIQQLYSAAIEEVSTKLRILDDEFQVRYEHNPIHHIESRLKHFRSISEKLIRKGLNPTTKVAMENLMDIAGVRVICNYIEDVYTIADLLTRQSDITLINKKDYIKLPKPNGYRSLHIIVSVPIFLSETTENIPVEIQLRTIAMDYWASLEHELKYKTESEMNEDLKTQLYNCANGIADIEYTMQNIHRKVQIQK